MTARIAFAAAVAFTLALSPSLGLASTAPDSSDEARALVANRPASPSVAFTSLAGGPIGSTDAARALVAALPASPAIATAWLAGGPISSTDDARRSAACRRAGEIPAPSAGEPMLACSLW